MSLQARITLSVAVAVAAILVAFGYGATWTIRESTSEVLQDRVQLAKILAGQVAIALTADRYALQGLAQTLSQNPDLAWEERALQQAVESQQFTRLALVTRAGAPVWAHPAGWLTHNVSVPSLVPRPASSGTVAPPVLATLPGARLAAFILPLQGSGRFLVGGIDVGRAGRVDVVHALDGASFNAEIIDAQALVLASSQLNEVGLPTEHLPVIAELVRQGRAGIAFHNLPGNPHYVAIAPLPGYAGWAVDVEQPRDLVLALPYDLKRRMALLGVAIVAGTSLLAFVTARLFAVARREERNLASTVDLLSDGLLTMTLDRRIVSLNSAAEGLLGWTSEEARGLMCTELLACSGCPVGHTESPCLLEAALKSGQAVRGVRLRARRRGGETFPVSLTVGFGRDEADQPTHFIVAISDMTTEEAYERQLRKRIHQLTALHEVTQALNLLPLRTVEETARNISERISTATGGRCRLDLEPRDPRPPEIAAVSTRSSEGADGLSSAGLVGEPLVLQGRRIGTLCLDPGPAGLTEGNPTLVSIIASQVAVAIENARLFEEVQDRDALRRQLLERIVTAQEEERRRIARELHDQIGPALTALVMQLGGVARGLPPEVAALRDRLVGIREMTSQTVGDVRRLMLNLRPVVLDDLGLVPAIRWYAEAYLRPAGIDAQVSVAGLDEHARLPEHLELAAFRLTQEALTNVVRHARATRVTITLERTDGTLALSIGDNGCGFDAEKRTRPGPHGGWGLVGIRERAALLRGRMTVSSHPGRGTNLTVTLPIGETADGR